MRKIAAYNFLTLNGFFKGPNEDTSWHRHGGEEARNSEEMLRQDNILLFGRKTYALPDGTMVFKGIKQKLDLQLTDSMIFKSGVVLLCYQPMKNS